MDIKAFFNVYVLLFALLIGGLIGLCGYFFSIDQAVAYSLLHEEGTVEQLSALGYFLCVFVLVALGRSDYFREHFPLVAFPMLFGLRELDFDKRFTETGLLQSRIITGDDVLVHERILGLVVMVTILGLAFQALRVYFLSFLKGLLRLDSMALGVALAMAFLVLSKTIDGLGRKLEPFGIIVSEQMTFAVAVVEEVSELGIPFVLIITAVAYFKQQPELSAQPVTA
jgi:hypothetical protein